MTSVLLLRAAFSLLFLMFVSGCAAQRAAEQKAALTTATESCKAQFAAGPHAHTAERFKCIAGAEDSILGGTLPYPDLLNLKHQSDNALARKVDAGELSLDDAALQQAENRTRLQNIFEQRRNSRVTADAQTDQAFYSGVATTQLSRSVTTSCNRFGNSTNCTTK